MFGLSRKVLIGLGSAVAFTASSAYGYHEWRQAQPVKGYKAFNADLTCRGHKYEVGKTYELPQGVPAEICDTGFHFCQIPTDCNQYYPKGGKTRYAEIEAWKPYHWHDKSVTAKIRIAREIPSDEWGKMTGRFEGRTKTVYLKDGKFHREDGPAVAQKDGRSEWYRHGELHREDGPAREGPNSVKEWWRGGVRYNDDGDDEY